MDKIDDGGPAFPCEVDSTQPLHRQVGNTIWQTYGLTMRDYFAAKAMQALIASRSIDHENGYYDEDVVGDSAYAMADSMLATRSKP